MDSTVTYITAALVTGIQIAIAVLGRFVIGKGRLSKYEQCFELSLNASLDASKGSANTSVSIDQLLDNFDYPVRHKEVQCISNVLNCNLSYSLSSLSLPLSLSLS